MVYVMSDIHGNYDAFRSVMNQIRLRQSDTLYVLGDVIDRHPYGIKILKYLMKKPNVKMLLGNHEYMMLDVVGNQYDESNKKAQTCYYKKLRLWSKNSGKQTLESFERCRKDTKDSIIAYLKSLPTEIDISVNGISYKLVHGAPIDFYEKCKDSYNYANSKEFSVWHRLNGKEDEKFNLNYTMVFGHTPTYHYADNNPLEIWKSPNGKLIGIDCGSGFPSPGGSWGYIGRLACLRLEDMTVFYSANSIMKGNENEM